jgi:transposase InsO family protein
VADGLQGAEWYWAAIGPLSVLDDHSRYLVALEQTGTTRSEAIRERLEDAFRTSGLPDVLLMDHGVPWWNARSPNGWTQLLVWLVKQGICCFFSGVRHPQTGVPTDRFSSVGWKRRARWSGFTVRWSVRAAGRARNSG